MCIMDSPEVNSVSQTNDFLIVQLLHCFHMPIKSVKSAIWSSSASSLFQILNLARNWNIHLVRQREIICLSTVSYMMLWSYSWAWFIYLLLALLSQLFHQRSKNTYTLMIMLRMLSNNLSQCFVNIAHPGISSTHFPSSPGNTTTPTTLISTNWLENTVQDNPQRVYVYLFFA